MTASTSKKELGEKKELVGQAALQQAIQFGLFTAPFGGLYAFSRGFWFASPAGQAWKSVAIKTGAWGILAS